MNTGFACPACRAPLVLRFEARPAAPAPERATSQCPNPFCRAELPSGRAEMDVVYALVGAAMAETSEVV